MENEILKVYDFCLNNGFTLEQKSSINQAVFTKKKSNRTIRVLCMNSCWDIDVWEGDLYTIDKPNHKIYIGGRGFDYFIISLNESYLHFNKTNSGY